MLTRRLGETRKSGGGAPCPECGGRSTYRVKGSDLSYCYTCRKAYSEIPDAPYDLVLDEWDARLAGLQAAGDVVLVRLPKGFIGVCILSAATRAPARRVLTPA
ncbi:MAG: hypothetical protein HY660_11900 [Armatimonadetes bacterium]|nr:hypothetical protein [Armatimonadota bacterium]